MSSCGRCTRDYGASGQVYLQEHNNDMRTGDVCSDFWFDVGIHEFSILRQNL